MCRLVLLALLLLVAPIIMRTAAASSQQQQQRRRRRVLGWTAFRSCGDLMCANMSRQIDQIVRHANVLDTVMPYTGAAAPQYGGVNHSACYTWGNGTLQRVANVSPWPAFRFGGPGVHVCAPYPDSLVTAWVEPLRRAGVASMPVLQGWPGTFPKAGADEGFFQSAVALAKKFGLAGWNLDVEPEKGGRAKLEEYAAFLTTFTARMTAAGLRLSSAEPNGYINTTRSGASPCGGRTGIPCIGNWSGYAPIGHAGAEVQTMDTYYGVQPLNVKGILPAEIASWKTAVPVDKLSIGFGGLYAAWGSRNCAMTPGEPLYNVSGINQTCTLRLSLADVVAANVSSVSVFTLNAFGCGTKYKFPMCQFPVHQVWPPESWWPLLHDFRHGGGGALGA
jgi:hypothetical protein